ncbi:hypothetical protein EDB89DRAFT_1915040, partial [Lactarius sanguifluus]
SRVTVMIAHVLGSWSSPVTDKPRCGCRTGLSCTTRRLDLPSPIPRLKYALLTVTPTAPQASKRIWMPNDVEKECERARRQRVREEERRRENERRLEGQRREFERRCEALRRRKAAADEENDAALAKNGRDERRAPWSNDQGRRSGKLKRRNRRARAKGEMDAETKTPAGRASPAPAKKEHPWIACDRAGIVESLETRANPKNYLEAVVEVGTSDGMDEAVELHVASSPRQTGDSDAISKGIGHSWQSPLSPLFADNVVQRSFIPSTPLDPRHLYVSVSQDDVYSKTRSSCVHDKIPGGIAKLGSFVPVALLAHGAPSITPQNTGRLDRFTHMTVTIIKTKT